MNIAETLKQEARDLEKTHENSTILLRKDVVNVMICFQFSDGRMHFIFPQKKVVNAFITELQKISYNNEWDHTRRIFEKSILIPFIDKDEMSI